MTRGLSPLSGTITDLGPYLQLLTKSPAPLSKLQARTKSPKSVLGPSSACKKQGLLFGLMKGGSNTPIDNMLCYAMVCYGMVWYNIMVQKVEP